MGTIEKGGGASEDLGLAGPHRPKVTSLITHWSENLWRQKSAFVTRQGRWGNERLIRKGLWMTRFTLKCKSSLDTVNEKLGAFLHQSTPLVVISPQIEVTT